ncbi:MAG: hypothetical protein KF764_15395 [Labilithrix sp.]|nr:hypothetical protein [Labilithrix sp.]MBX3221023.1 hypothetical protein [Labilithrix sp.]
MVSTKKIWLFLCLVLVLAGCGGGVGGSGGGAKSAGNAPEAQGYPPAQYAAESVSSQSSGPRTASIGATADAAQPSPAPPPRSEEKSTSREPSPDSRPGLGTEWGETRTSRVHDVTFVRDSSRPFALATLHYNDRRGVDAMANLAAQRETRHDVPAGGGAVTIAIKDASGNPLEAVRAGDRTLVVGQAGQRYSVVLTNHTSHRFESVVTVDGLDVINGKPGTAENRGYVLLPFATLEIEGFRQSSNAVAAFRFAAVGESYAAQTGSARNVGVIGVALFGERGDSFVSQSELRMRDTASPFPADPRFAQPPRR